MKFELNGALKNIKSILQGFNSYSCRTEDYVKTKKINKKMPVAITVDIPDCITPNDKLADELWVTIEMSKEDNKFLDDDFLAAKQIYISFVDPKTKEQWFTIA